jgi:uncharacterized protein involved in type VI secretion and phage assembly
MQLIRNQIALAARMANADRATTRLGTVTSYDPNDCAVVVTLRPDGVQTGWLPVVSPWSGNGWGMFAPPTPGDLVEVQFVDDNLEVGFVCQRFFTDQNRSLACPSGEFWLVHQSGSCFKFHNDGSVDLTSHANLTATVGGNLVANVTGNANLTAGGNATVQASGTATIKAASIILQNAGAALRKICTDLFVTLYNGHTHTSATAGSQTSQPTQQATTAHTTTTVQAE